VCPIAPVLSTSRAGGRVAFIGYNARLKSAETTTMSIPPPRSRPIEGAARNLLVGALFTVSFSTWLTNILLGLLLLAGVAAWATAERGRDGAPAWPGRFALALLALLALGTTWSIAPRAEALFALTKYLKLALVPIAIWLGRRHARLGPAAFAGYMAGSSVLAVCTYLVYAGLMPTSPLHWWRVGEHADAFVFKNHITTGILLSFSTVAALVWARHAGTARARVAGVVAAAGFLIPTVFLTQGRTGWVALFVGLVALYVRSVRPTVARTAAGLLALALLFTGFYFTSTNVRTRTDALVSELQADESRSPNGLRRAYMEVGLRTIAAHPLTGVGTGAFATVFAPTAARLWPTEHTRHQPHSEVLHITLQVGLTGLALYLAMLGSLAAPALRARSAQADLLLILSVIYATCSVFNSLLWDPTEASWFLLLAGALYGSLYNTSAGTRPSTIRSPSPP
jgi:O-antigen ligase